MVRGLVIPADESEPIEERDFAALEDYQVAVGGFIEPVDIPDLVITIYVNEDGLLQQLPLNSRATFLWWYHVPESRQGAMLVGDVVIVGWPDKNGDNTDVPTNVAQLLRLDARFAIEARTSTDDDWSRDDRTYEFVEAVVGAMLISEQSAGQMGARIVPVH